MLSGLFSIRRAESPRYRLPCRAIILMGTPLCIPVYNRRAARRVGGEDTRRAPLRRAGPCGRRFFVQSYRAGLTQRYYLYAYAVEILSTTGNGVLMHLLIKTSSHLRLAAHIPDVHGMPLCGLNLKLIDWLISDLLDMPFICRSCTRKQAKETGM